MVEDDDPMRGTEGSAHGAVGCLSNPSGLRDRSGKAASGVKVTRALGGASQIAMMFGRALHSRLFMKRTDEPQQDKSLLGVPLSIRRSTRGL